MAPLTLWASTRIISRRDKGDPLGLTSPEHKVNNGRVTREDAMSASLQADPLDESALEAAVDEAIAACDGDLRATIRALIVANQYLETEVGELMKAVSHAYTRGRFQTYSG